MGLLFLLVDDMSLDEHMLLYIEITYLIAAFLRPVSSYGEEFTPHSAYLSSSAQTISITIASKQVALACPAIKANGGIPIQADSVFPEGFGDFDLMTPTAEREAFYGECENEQKNFHSYVSAVSQRKTYGELFMTLSKRKWPLVEESGVLDPSYGKVSFT